MGCRQQRIDNPFLKVYQTPQITQEYKEARTNKIITTIHHPKTAITIQDKYLAIPLPKVMKIYKKM